MDELAPVSRNNVKNEPSSESSSVDTSLLWNLFTVQCLGTSISMLFDPALETMVSLRDAGLATCWWTRCRRIIVIVLLLSAGLLTLVPRRLRVRVSGERRRPAVHPARRPLPSADPGLLSPRSVITPASPSSSSSSTFPTCADNTLLFCVTISSF